MYLGVAVYSVGLIQDSTTRLGYRSVRRNLQGFQVTIYLFVYSCVYSMKGGSMQQEKIVQGRWQALSNAEKFFTVFIALSIVCGFSLLALEASNLVTLPGFLG